MIASVPLCLVILAAGVFMPLAVRADEAPHLAVVSGARVSAVARGQDGLNFQEGDPVDGRTRLRARLHHQWEAPWVLRHPVRWRLGFGYYWGVSLAGPGPSQPFANLVRSPLAELRRENGDEGVDEKTAPPDEVGPVEPLTIALLAAETRQSGPVYFDLIPLGPQACRLFVLRDGRIELWDYHFTWDADRGLRGEWKEAGRASLDWNEPFLTLPDGPGRTFLVNRTGRVWELTARGDGHPTLRAVWSDPARPVRWIVLDISGSRAVALGPGFAFRVEGQPRPVDAANVPGDPDPANPLAAAAAAARAAQPLLGP